MVLVGLRKLSISRFFFHCFEVKRTMPTATLAAITPLKMVGFRKYHQSILKVVIWLCDLLFRLLCFQINIPLESYLKIKPFGPFPAVKLSIAIPSLV